MKEYLIFMSVSMDEMKKTHLQIGGLLVDFIVV